MMRKLVVPVLAAVVLVMILGTVAFAADAPAVQVYGQCATFVDADGDGVCDNAGIQVPPRDGTGSQNGKGSCLDANGDGVCDHTAPGTRPADGTGRQNGSGRGSP